MRGRTSKLGMVAFGLLLCGAARLAVAPLGDAVAAALARQVQPHDRAAPEAAPVAADRDDPRDDPAPIGNLALRAAIATPRVESREEARDGGATRDGGARVGTIVVPVAAVTRALAKHDVGARNAVAVDGTALGARLFGVGKYHAGLQDGDIVVAVAGTRTPTVEAMVAVALQAASGASRLSGRIVRGEVTYAVVIELPP